MPMQPRPRAETRGPLEARVRVITGSPADSRGPECPPRKHSISWWSPRPMSAVLQHDLQDHRFPFQVDTVGTDLGRGASFGLDDQILAAPDVAHRLHECLGVLLSHLRFDREPIELFVAGEESNQPFGSGV